MSGSSLRLSAFRSWHLPRFFPEGFCEKFLERQIGIGILGIQKTQIPGFPDGPTSRLCGLLHGNRNPDTRTMIEKETASTVLASRHPALIHQRFEQSRRFFRCRIVISIRLIGLIETQGMPQNLDSAFAHGNSSSPGIGRTLVQRHPSIASQTIRHAQVPTTITRSTDRRAAHCYWIVRGVDIADWIHLTTLQLTSISTGSSVKVIGRPLIFGSQMYIS